MAGLIDRVAALAGTELGKAVDLAHRFYKERMEFHNHSGRAIAETAAEVARNHPNLIGIGVGLLVEQFLAEQKRRHDVHMAEAGALEGHPHDAPHPHAEPKPHHDPHHAPKALPAPGTPHHHLPPLLHLDRNSLSKLRPATIAFEVFGGLMILKLASSGVKMFQHHKQHDPWFEPAARIRLFSGTIATYYLVKSLKSPKLSAWRNAAVVLFATDAIKPVLKVPKVRKQDRLK